MAQKRVDGKVQALSLDGAARTLFTRGYQGVRTGCSPLTTHRYCTNRGRDMHCKGTIRPILEHE